jgi:hypothetical protein
MRKALRLTVPEDEEATQQQGQQGGQGQGSGGGPEFSPSDVSFLYKGYAPLSIRLVEQALKPQGWSPLAEVSGRKKWREEKGGGMAGLGALACTSYAHDPLCCPIAIRCTARSAGAPAASRDPL